MVSHEVIFLWDIPSHVARIMTEFPAVGLQGDEY